MKPTRFATGCLCAILALGFSVADGDTAFANAKKQAKAAKNEKKTRRAMNQITIDCQDGVATIGVNGEGNLIQFESPQGFEHVGVGTFSEGYVIKWDTPFASITIFDVGPFAGQEFGFGEAAFVPGGNFSVRYSLDGSVKLTQTFTPDCDQRKLIVEHEVQNCTGGLDPICSGGGVNLDEVCLARQVDFDVDTGGDEGFAGFINNHAASTDAYIAWNDKNRAPETHSMHLSILNPQRGPVDSVAKVTNQILDTNCPANDVAGAGPRLNVDDGGRIEATTADIAPGESVTLLLEYKRD